MMTMTPPFVLGFGLPGGYEWIILLVLGLIIFGRRLPEVGRSLGRSIVEFKRGIKGIEDEIDTESSQPAEPPRMSAKIGPQELPTPSEPSEPRVSRGDEVAAGGAEADEIETSLPDADRSSS